MFFLNLLPVLYLNGRAIQFGTRYYNLNDRLTVVLIHCAAKIKIVKENYTIHFKKGFDKRSWITLQKQNTEQLSE